MEHHLLKCGDGETVRVDPRIFPSPYHCDNCEIQISNNLHSKFNILSNNGINSKKHWKIVSKFIFQTHFREVLQRQSISSQRKFDSTQALLFPFLSCYANMLVTNVDSKLSRRSTQAISILHILDHVITCRGRISKHDRRIKLLENQSDDNDIDDDVWRRDQGFTRPTVLVLLPTRTCCYDFVQMIITTLGCSNAENVERFETEYGPTQVLEAEERLKDDERKLRRLKVIQQKGSEWNDLFGDDANDDDDFKMGISLIVTKNSRTKKKTSQKNTSTGLENNHTLKLFSDFYKSDIILASPLGLKMVTSKRTEGQHHDDEDDDDTSNEANKADFLSSIEICMTNSINHH
jgi:Utp25, U3 small nucleolar RNA-associated SSU processome protein 25